jgi:hypothetical protein
MRHLTRGPASLKTWFCHNSVTDSLCGWAAGEAPPTAALDWGGWSPSSAHLRDAFFDLAAPGWTSLLPAPGPVRWRQALQMSFHPVTNYLSEAGYAPEEVAYWEAWRVAALEGAPLPEAPEAVSQAWQAWEHPIAVGDGLGRAVLLSSLLSQEHDAVEDQVRSWAQEQGLMGGAVKLNAGTWMLLSGAPLVWLAADLRELGLMHVLAEVGEAATLGGLMPDSYHEELSRILAGAGGLLRKPYRHERDLANQHEREREVQERTRNEAGQ